MSDRPDRLTEREPVLVVSGVAAVIVAAIQAVIPYLPGLGVPAKIVTIVTTILGLVGAGAFARAKVVSPATWKAQTGQPVPHRRDLPERPRKRGRRAPTP